MSALDDMLAQSQAYAQQQNITSRTPGHTMAPNVPTAVAQPAQQQGAPPPTPVKPQQKRSFLQQAGDFLVGGTPTPGTSMAQQIADSTPGWAKLEGQVATSALPAIARIPGQVMGSVLDTTADAGKFVSNNIDPYFAKLPFSKETNQALSSAVASTVTPGGQALGAIQQAKSFAARLSGGNGSLADTLSMRSTLGQMGSPQLNQTLTNVGALGASLMTGAGEAQAGAEGLPLAAKVLSKVPALLASSARVGAATAILAQPEDHIANALQAAGVHNQLIDWLAANPQDEALENRAKAGVEGFIANMALEPAAKLALSGLTKLVRGANGSPIAGALTDEAQGDLEASAKAAKPPTVVQVASPDEAAADKLNRTLATQRTTDERLTQADQQVAEEVPPVSDGVRPPDAKPSEGGTGDQAGEPSATVADLQKAPPVDLHHGTDGVPPQEASADAGQGSSPDSGGQGSPQVGAGAEPEGSGGPHPRQEIADAANAQLKAAGTNEVVSPESMNIRSDGRITVSPQSKAALETAGNGRAFASSNEMDNGSILFKEQDPVTGSFRLVGSIGKEDLQGFLDDADKFMQDAKSRDAFNINETAGPYDSLGQWSIGRLGASYDVPAFMRALADHLPPNQQLGLTNLEVQKMAQAMANQTGLAPDDILHLAGEVVGSTRDLAVGVQTVRTIQTRLIKDLMDLHGLPFADLDEGAPQLMDAYEAVHNAMTFAQHVAETKTGVGQALQVMQLPDADTYLANVGKVDPAKVTPKAPPDTVPVPRTKQELMDWMNQLDAVVAMNDPAALQKFFSGKLVLPGKWGYLGTSFPNFFTGAIVSAPRTFVRDLWGPAIISGLNTIGRTGAGAMLALNPALDEAARREAWVASWGAARAYATTLSDVADAMKSAAKVTASGFQKGAKAVDPYWDPFGANLGSSTNSFHGSNPIDMNAAGVPRVLIDAAMGRDGAGVTGAVPYWAGNLINKLPQAVMAVHGGFNELAGKLAFLGEVRAGAYNEASQMGLQGQDFKQFLLDRLTQARDPTIEADWKEAANDAAQRTTLTRHPDETDPQLMQAAFQTRANIIRACPPARFIIPIFNVPANALGESLRRIPGLGFAMKQSGEELTGQHGVAAMADAYGRMLTGAGALTAGVMLAQTGALTGAGPENAIDRLAWQGQGADGSMIHQPYSIRIGGQWYSYQKADVIGPMLSIVSAFYDKTLHTQEDLGSHALAAAGGLADYFKDQASLQGLAQVLNFGGDPQETPALFTRIMGQTASGFVPGFLKQARDVLDPNQRIHRTIGDYLMDSIPLVSKTLDPVRNVIGEPVMKPQSPMLGTLPISMSNLNSYAKDPVQDEHARLYEVTGEAHGVLPTGLGPNSQKDMRDITLEDGTSLYDAMMRYRQVSKVDGQSLRQTLTDLYASQEYHDAIDGKSTAATTEEGQDVRGSMARQVFSEFTSQTRQDVANASPIAARYFATAYAMNHDPVIAQTHTTDELARSTDLLHSLGVPIEDYEAAVRGQ